MSIYPEFLTLPNYSWLSVAAYEHCGVAYLISRNYTVNEAAAIMGNLRQESAYNPNAKRANDAGPGRDSVGIAQWNRTRLANMLTFVAKLLSKDYDNLLDYEKYYGQLTFVCHELATTYLNTAATVLATNKNSPNCAALFGHIYEGFSANSAAARNNNAAQIIKTFKA